jgi:hypothetical protein
VHGPACIVWANLTDSWRRCQRLAGLLIASRHPILRCAAAAFDKDSYEGSMETFADKGVLGALLDLGGGAPSHGRWSHWVPTSIGTCSITAMIVCISEDVPMEVGA